MKALQTFKKINLPNKLTILRVILIPFFMVFLLIPAENYLWMNVTAAAIFMLASATDALDGAIARSRGLVTNFGKFLDPLADKCLVLSAFLCIIASDRFADLRLAAGIAVSVVIFRELAVTSMRLVVTNTDGTVVAANTLGKLKTIFQILTIVIILLEEVILPDSSGWLKTYHLGSYAMLILMTALTVVSGAAYLKKYFSYLDPTK